MLYLHTQYVQTASTHLVEGVQHQQLVSGGVVHQPHKAGAKVLDGQGGELRQGKRLCPQEGMPSLDRWGVQAEILWLTSRGKLRLQDIR